MPCNVFNLTDYPKLSQSLRNKVGTDDKLYLAFASEAVINGKINHEFAEYCKETLGFEADLDGDMCRIIPALERFYNYKHPDVDITAIHKKSTFGSFTSVDAREFAKRHVGSLINDFYFQANIIKANDKFIVKPDGSNQREVYNNYINAVKKRINNELSNRFNRIQEENKDKQSYKELLEKYKDNPTAGVLIAVKRFGTVQDKNIAALFEEILVNPNAFFTEVFRDNRLSMLKQDFSNEVINEENADENENTNEEDDVAKDDDSVDTYITSLNQKLGDYASFTQHVDGYLKSYFNGLKKLKSSTKSENDEYDYDKNNELGVTDTMSSEECCLALFTYGDFSSVDNMIKSIEIIANNLDGFAAFAKLADDLRRNRNFANYVYTVFGKTIISKIETVVDAGAGRTNISNKASNKLSQLYFEFVNSIKTSAIENDFVNTKDIYNTIKSNIDKYEKKYKLLEVSGDLYNKTLKELNDTKSEIKEQLFDYLHRYYPTITEGAISNYLINNEVNGNKDFILNAKLLLTILNDTIKSAESTIVEYNNRQAQLNEIYKHNAKLNQLKSEGEYVSPNSYKSAGEIYSRDFLSNGSKKAALDLAVALENFELVKTELNSRNVHGNNSSDVINNSMFTNIINTLKNRTALENYGKYRFKGRQYDFSNIMMEHRDDKGRIINYGLFTYDDSNNLIPTPYAQDLLKISLYNGSSDLQTNSNAVYSEMSKGDYVASAFINFFNAEDIQSSNGEIIPMANYFSRIPSDAPKTFVIKAPKYNISNLFEIANKKESDLYLRDKINEIQNKRIEFEKGIELGYATLNANIVDRDTILNHLTKEIKPIYVRKQSMLNEDNVKNGDTVTITYTYSEDTGYDSTNEVSYVIQGTYKKENNKIFIDNPQFIGLLNNNDSIAYLPEKLRESIEDVFTEEGIANGTIKQQINREHPIFKQYQQIIKQELINAATAIDILFQHNNGVISIDKNNMPKFKDGYDNTSDTDRKVYEIYHRGKKKHILEEDGNGRYKLTGKVFTSDKLELYDRKNNKLVNYIQELIGNDGTINFLYGGDTNSLHFTFDENNDIVLQLTDEQQKAIDDNIEKFIIDYVEDTSDRMNDYMNFMPSDLSNKRNYADFALNNHLAYINFDDLFEGEVKFYPNAQNFLKRAKEVQASGVPFGLTNYEQPLDAPQIPLDSELDNNPIFTTYVDSNGNTISRQVKQQNKFRAVTIKNTIRASDAIPTLIKALVDAGVSKEQAEKMMEGYKGVTVNDAQSYITYEEWIRRVSAKGELTKYKKLIDAINDETKEIDAETLNQWVQVQKNFYYDLYYDEKLKIVVPRQIKNAEFVLIPRFIKGTELEEVYNVMMEHNVDQLNTEETSKAAKRNVLTVWDESGKITDELDDFKTNIDNSAELFNYNYLYKQQDTPQHMDAQNKAGIQIMKKILDNIDESSPIYKYKEDLMKNYVANIKESFNELIDELKIPVDENGNIKLDKEGNIEGIDVRLFYDRLYDEAQRLGLDSNMLDYVTLQDDVAEPIMRSYMNNTSSKLESIAQSIFNSRITRQKLPGFHAAQVTGVGFNFVAGKDNGGKNSVGISKNLQYHPDGKPYIEVLIAKPIQLANLSDEEALAKMQAAGVDEFIGYRIPTEGKQSISIMKVVGFTNNAQGSTIVVPDDWVAQTGADFDIDSIYAITKQFYVDKKGNIQLYKYNTINNFDSYINYVRRNVDRKIREGYKFSQDDITKYKKEYKEYIDEVNKETENKLEDKVKQLIADEAPLYKEADAIIQNALKSVDKKLKSSDISLPYNEKVELYITALETSLELKPDAKNGQSILDLYREIAATIDLQQEFSKAKYEQYKETIGENIANYIEELTRENTIKMAKVSGLMSFEEFSNRPVEENNSRNSRNNQILEDMLQILRSPASLEENLSRSNFDDIIDSRDAVINNNVKKRRNNRSPYNFLDQADFQEDVMSGAKLKAFSVTRDTFCSICNTVKPKITDKHNIKVVYYESDGYSEKELLKHFDNVNSVTINGKKAFIVSHNTIGWSKDNKNVDNKLITPYSSQTTAHILDAVKEGAVPNVNDLTFAVYKTIADVGSNYKTAVSFIMQPGVTRIVNAYNKNKSIYNKGGNFNPVHTAIKELAKELGLDVNEYSSINDTISKLNETFGKEFARVFSLKDINAISLDINSFELNFDANRFAERLKLNENDNNKTFRLLFDLGVILQYNKLSYLANRIGDIARVTNPDKFGAKQTIYATNKVFDDIRTLIADKNKILYVEKDDKKIHILESIYPDVYKGLNGYIKSNNMDSSYPSLNAFLKYATATSIKINQMLFRTERKSFREAIAGLEDYINGNMTEQLYKDFKTYVLAKIYNSTNIINYNVSIHDGDLVFDKTQSDELEKARIYGYGKTPDINYDINDINKPTEEEIDNFSKLSPAQKIYWIKSKFRNPGVFKYIDVNLFNEYQYRKNKSSQQTISFNENVQNIETIYNEFDKAFFNSNPLIKLAAVDIIKYASVVEGFRMRRKGVSKIIKNNALYTSIKDGGTGFIEECDNGINNLSDSDITKLYDNFIRSHSTIKQIATYRNKKLPNNRYEINTENYGLITFNLNDKNSAELAIKSKFIKSIEREGNDITINSNKYVRLITNRQSKLYKVDVRGLHVYAYPVSLLEEYENSTWSANSFNNNGYYEEPFYISIINDAEQTNRNITEISKEYKEKADEYKYKNPYKVDNTKFVKEFDLMNPTEQDMKHIGGFKAVVEQINNEFNKIDSPTSIWIRSEALTNYIPVGGYSVQNIEGKYYLIKRLNLNQTARTYLQGKNINKTIKETNPYKVKIIEQAREQQAIKLNDVFNIMPYNPVVETVNNEDDGIRNSSITEDPVIELANSSIRNMRRRSSVSNDRDANKILNNFREKGIDADNRMSLENQEEVIRTTSAYIEATVEKLMTDVDYFFKDDDGISHSINDSKTIEYIKKHKDEKDRFIKLILDASTFGANYGIIKDLDIDAQDPNLQPWLIKIKNNIQKLENSTTINNARTKFFLEYLNELSDNPLIQSDIITLVDGFNNIGFFESWISDIQETSVPLIQVVLKEVMSNIRSKEFIAKDRVNEFEKKIKDIRKRAREAGKNINFNNIIDEYGRFIQPYTDKLLEDLNNLRKERDEAITKYGKGSKEYLEAKRKYDKWKLEYTNQVLLDDYYQRKLEIESNMLDKFPTIYEEYKKLEAKRDDILSHIINGTLEESYKEQLKKINEDMFYLRSEYDSLGNLKLHIGEGGKGSNSIEAAHALKNYLENMKILREEYFDKDVKYGFQEQLDKNLEIIKSYEKRDSLGRLTTPINILMQHEDYKKAKEWLDNNAIFIIQSDLKKSLDEAFLLLKDSKLPNSTLNNIARKIDAYDNKGIIDGRKFSEEDVLKIKEEQETKYNINNSTAYSDETLIKNSPTDDTVYRTSFYEGMVAKGTSNPDRLAIIKKINVILQPYYDNVHKLIRTWEISEDNLKELKRLYEELEEVGGKKNVTNRKQIKQFIEDNVEFTTDNVKYEQGRIAAQAKGNAYYTVWLYANTETVIDETTGESIIQPNHYIYGYAKPKKEVESKFIDEKKTRALRVIHNNVEFIPTEYYYQTLLSMDTNSEEFKTWYNNNHIYNPYTHQIEPLRIWTTMKVYGRADEGEWVARYNQKESQPNPLKLNSNYKENLGVAQNYKKGSGYDRINTANEYELELKQYLQEVLSSLVYTDKAKKYIEMGYLPSRNKQKEHDVAFYMKEFAKSFGFINDGKVNPNWAEDIDYALDYTIDMPMLQQLGNKNSKELKPIPKQLEGQSDEDYNNEVNKIKEENEKIKEENAKIHKELLDNNWEDVFKDFIMQASHYNALQENKYLLFLGLQQLRNIKMYKTRIGRKTLLKDKKRSTEDSPVYHTESPKYAEQLYENTIRRILYGQFKKPQGNFTKAGNILQSIASAKYMMFNITGGLANVMYGSTQILGERFAKEYFGHADWEAAKLMWIQAVPSFFNNMYSENSSSIVDGIIKFMNIVDFDRISELSTDINTEEFIKRLRNAAFSPQTAGEHFMQNTAMLALMRSNRLYYKNGKLVANSFERYKRDLEEDALLSVIGEDKDLLDKYNKFKSKIKEDANETIRYATFRNYIISDFINNYFNVEQKKEYVDKKKEFTKKAKEKFEDFTRVIDQFTLKDGKITIKPDSELSKLSKEDAYKLLAEFKGKAISVNKKIHGVYDKLGAARIESEWWGGLVMQYHKHLYPGFMKRYRRKGYFNEERQTIEKGSYNALFDFIAMPITKFRNDMQENEYTALEGIQNLMKNIVNFSLNAKLNWELLPDNEKALIRRNLGDLLGVMSALFMSIAIRLIDDDDEGFLYNLAIYSSDRLASESMAYTIPGAISEGEKLWSSPIAASGGITDLLTSAGVFVQMLMQGDEYDPTYTTGLYAGENKMKVMITRQIPIYRSIDRLIKLEKNNKYYKLSDNILSVVPVNEIVEWIED